jgi:hypothetical protein
MDGLSLFIEKSWDMIKHQKELNLPDQRVMVASLRCNELKEEALLNVQPFIDALKEESEKQLVENFEDSSKGIMKQAITHFDTFGHHYDKKTYEKVRKEVLIAVTS